VDHAGRRRLREAVRGKLRSGVEVARCFSGRDDWVEVLFGGLEVGASRRRSWEVLGE
jgi:hypothetical protein